MSRDTRPALVAVEGVEKSFTMHLQGGQRLAVLRGLGFEVARGECVVLAGDSGAGKSSILKMVYGNYAVQAGAIVVDHDGEMIDLATASSRQVLAVRSATIGYVSQFLRAVPRVPALQVVAEPLIERGATRSEARARAAGLLGRLGIPERLWSLPPATFSGGEQQRVNIARGFITEHPLLLLDEPTASLDAGNRAVVIALVREQLAGGTGMLAIFHDPEVREALADRYVDVAMFAAEPVGGRG